MLNVLIVDDEPLARLNLRYLLEQDNQINILAECGNAIEAIQMINNFHPDVIFLDIQMPRISGLEMLKMIDPQHLPYVVLTTAYDKYTLEAFEEQVFDYLMKPIESQRLQKTLQRLHHEHSKQKTQELQSLNIPFKYIPCIGHNRIYLLNTDDIYYACSKISGIYVFNKENTEYLTELTLSKLEEQTNFVRCHKQYLINMNKLKAILFNKEAQAKVILENDVEVAVSRRYLKPLKRVLGL